ncbi:hypothetical protein ABTY63_00905 [Streptomyces solisilvae]|uniref:hypothetical protein n=1 Tax=Streptomyces malaysiensis TaxID=92644 RepID=UPI0033318654
MRATAIFVPVVSRISSARLMFMYKGSQLRVQRFSRWHTLEPWALPREWPTRRSELATGG